MPSRLFARMSGKALPSLSLVYTTLVFLLLTGFASAQTPFTHVVDQTMLKRVFPQAESFSEKTGEPPVYQAFGPGNSDEQPELLGYAFQTSDYPPEEIGYSSTIEVLVGLNTQAEINAVFVMNYNESFRSSRGDFLDTPTFQPQFRGKSLKEEFRVGRDVDGVSRATITSWATTRGIYNAAREVAAAYLPESGIRSRNDSMENVRAHLAPMSWDEMIAEDLIQQGTLTYPDGTQLTLSMTYMGDEVLGDILVGSGAYSQAERAASNRFDQGKLFLVHIAGNASDPFRQERLNIRQSDRFYDLDRRQSVYAGSSDAGKTAEQGNFSVAIVLPEDLDLSQGFTVSYDPENGQQPLTIDARINGVQRNLALGEPVPSAFAAPLTSDNNWSRLIPLAVLLTLVMVAFWRKSAALRWVALSATLLWLGFIDGGFLSVSHILNGLNQGMSLFTGNTALLLIVSFTLVTTLIWGRVFCSSVCPFGALQDIISYLTPKKWQRTVPDWLHDKAIYLKYLILVLLVAMALFYSQISLFQYFEPFGTLFFYSSSLVLWGILALILLACIPVKRFYCRYVCPLGASLGVLSLISISRINRVEQCTVCKVCEHSCPTGAIRKEKIDFKECVRCDICESKLIQKAGVCKHSVDSLIDRGVIARGG